jgi:hypothetical protein
MSTLLDQIVNFGCIACWLEQSEKSDSSPKNPRLFFFYRRIAQHLKDGSTNKYKLFELKSLEGKIHIE